MKGNDEYQFETTQSTPQSEQGFVSPLNVNQVTARKRKRRCGVLDESQKQKLYTTPSQGQKCYLSGSKSLSDEKIKHVVNHNKAKKASRPSAPQCRWNS